MKFKAQYYPMSKSCKIIVVHIMQSHECTCSYTNFEITVYLKNNVHTSIFIILFVKAC